MVQRTKNRVRNRREGLCCSYVDKKAFDFFLKFLNRTTFSADFIYLKYDARDILDIKGRKRLESINDLVKDSGLKCATLSPLMKLLEYRRISSLDCEGRPSQSRQLYANYSLWGPLAQKKGRTKSVYGTYKVSYRPSGSRPLYPRRRNIHVCI